MVKLNKKRCYLTTAYKEMFVISLVFLFDILSKFIISDRLTEDGAPLVVIKNFLNFSYTKNYKAAFSFDFFGLSEKLGEKGMRYFFIAFVSVTTLLFFIFLVVGRKNCFLYRLSLALIVGGALGNLYDRIVHKGVRDFIQVEYFGKTLFDQTAFPTFNLADSALVIGVGLFLIYFLFFFVRDEKRKRRLEEERLNASEQEE